MFSDLNLMNMHISALFIHDDRSRLLFVNESDGLLSPAPRLFLGRTRAGNVWRFRADLPETLCAELDALCSSEPLLGAKFNESPRNLEKYVRLLENDAAAIEISSGPAFCFADFDKPSKSVITLTKSDAELLQNGFEDLAAELSAWQPFIALINENRAVSVCRSVRITPSAHEAGVETLKDFRGRGFAKDVTAEWARKVRAIGAIPLYSTSWENHASQAVARKLDLKCYGIDFSIN